MPMILVVLLLCSFGFGWGLGWQIGLAVFTILSVFDSVLF